MKRPNHVLRSARDEQRLRSHFHLAGCEISGRRCEGIACLVARHALGEFEQEPADVDRRPTESGRLYCLGNCFAGPSVGGDASRPPMVIDAPVGVVLPRLVSGGARTLARSLETDGYASARAWLRRPSADLLAEVEHSGLRGRGGAGFPTATKWHSVAGQAATKKHVVVNADEGDPGAYLDRFLMEDDPHNVIEGALLAAYAVGAHEGTLYVRKEYPDSQRILRGAIDEARQAGWLGQDVDGSGFAFELEVVSGEGSYVCGEETALLNALEGEVPMVRARPPYPAEHGLFGRPTLVNNVETLAAVPWILRHGGEAYRRLGFSRSRGTKVVSLNSLFRRPGLYEVEFGIPVRRIVEELGGGLKVGEIRGVVIGGPLAGLLTPEEFDTPFGFEELQAVGASVGHGGIVAFGHETPIVDLVRHVFEFAADESCGKCTPCRLGSRAVERLLRRAPSTAVSPDGNGQGSRLMRQDDAEFVQRVVSALGATSLCGLGTGLAEFARSALRHFPKEMADAFDPSE